MRETEGVAAKPLDPDEARYTFIAPVDLLTRLRIHAAKKRVSLADLVRDLLTEGADRLDADEPKT